MLDDPIADLRARFIWTADKRDHWTLLDAPTGPLRGDCEDYALTALWLCAGRSWGRLWWMICTFQAMLWWTRFNGGGHIILWVRGRGWTDSAYRGWSKWAVHRLWFPYLVPILILALTLK